MLSRSPGWNCDACQRQTEGDGEHRCDVVQSTNPVFHGVHLSIERNTFNMAHRDCIRPVPIIQFGKIWRRRVTMTPA